MSNDNKTLADVQPGGRVRLGDSRSTRAATFLRQYLTYLRSSPRQGLRPRWCDVYEALEIAIEALSAQPSPGGQGNGPWPEIDMILADAYSAGAEGLQFEGIARRAAVRAAVAANTARQPEYLYGSDELRARVEGERAAYLEGLEEGKSIAARQPVGEPEIWVSPGQLEELKRRPAGQGSNYLPTRLASEGNFTQPLYAAPPAQAVDLGRIRSTVQALLNWIDDWAETPEESGIDAIEIEAAAVLDLIDSQGVQS
nr:hypothetical protein [Stenotrophomonas geniculata]